LYVFYVPEDTVCSECVCVGVLNQHLNMLSLLVDVPLNCGRYLKQYLNCFFKLMKITWLDASKRLSDMVASTSPVSTKGNYKFIIGTDFTPIHGHDVFLLR